MKPRVWAAGLAAGLAAAAAAHAGPVLMISIDGLRPLDVIDADARGARAPNLRRMMREGAYATGVRNALPSVTYPNHTTLVTGVWPARHGIAGNETFDPEGRNDKGWYWYARDIQVPTLWDAVHASGRRTASVFWPVTVDAPSIDDDIPEYWRAFSPQDAKLEHALATPGLPGAIAQADGARLGQVTEQTMEADRAKASMAEAIIRLHHPAFTTVHLAQLDEDEHAYAPGSKEAYATLEQLDQVVADLVSQARAAEPDVTVMVVSDHGFATVTQEINLKTAFVQAGLITLDAKGKVASWRASPWIQGSSCAVVLADPNDAALRAQVKALLDRLAADPASGVFRVLGREGIAEMGGGRLADFWVDPKLGYTFGGAATGPLVTPSAPHHGMHGMFPTHPEMRATLIVDGPGFPRHGSLREVDMRDIAPTAAKILGAALPSADGKPLF